MLDKRFFIEHRLVHSQIASISRIIVYAYLQWFSDVRYSQNTVFQLVSVLEVEGHQQKDAPSKCWCLDVNEDVEVSGCCKVSYSLM